jgi:hypothetical protein
VFPGGGLRHRPGAARERRPRDLRPGLTSCGATSCSR